MERDSERRRGGESAVAEIDWIGNVPDLSRASGVIEKEGEGGGEKAQEVVGERETEVTRHHHHTDVDSEQESALSTYGLVVYLP
jgi:hypothetical protein